MIYVYYTAAFAGVAWTFYVIGQYTGLKEMNRKINTLSVKRDEWRSEAKMWVGLLDSANEEASRLSGHVEILQDLLADIHTYTAEQKSGTAQKVARMAKAGLAK